VCELCSDSDFCLRFLATFFTSGFFLLFGTAAGFAGARLVAGFLTTGFSETLLSLLWLLLERLLPEELLREELEPLRDREWEDLLELLLLLGLPEYSLLLWLRPLLLDDSSFSIDSSEAES